MLDKEIYKKILYFNSKSSFTKEELIKEIGTENLMRILVSPFYDEKIKSFLTTCELLNISLIAPELENKMKIFLELDNINEEIINNTFTELDKEVIINSKDYLCRLVLQKCANYNFLEEDHAISLLSTNKRLFHKNLRVVLQAIKDDKKLIPIIKKLNDYDIKLLIENRIEPFSKETTEVLLSMIPQDSQDYQDLIKGVLIKTLDNDRKIDFITNNKKAYFVLDIIETLPTDLKLKYLNKLPIYERVAAIKSIEEDNIKIKFLKQYSTSKGEIISSLQDDKLKEELLLKNRLTLSSEAIGMIVASFKDNSYVEKYLYLLKSEKSRVEFLKRSNPSQKAYQLEVFKNIRKKSNIINCIFSINSLEAQKEIINSIEEQEVLIELFSNAEKEIRPLLLQKLNEKNREKVIKNAREDGDDVFYLYQYLENDSFLYESILHSIHFPKYDESYNNIINRVANYVHVDKENLLKFVHLFDMQVLAKLENTNLKALLNSSSADFIKIINLFSGDLITFDTNNQNDALNAIIQRKFRVTHPNDILIFSQTLHAIADNHKDKVIELVDRVLEIVSLDKFNITREDLIKGLVFNDSHTIKTYNRITNEYLNILRANYDIEEKYLAEKLYKDTEYEKNDLVKYILKNIPISVVIREMNKKSPRNFQPEELALLKNDNLLKQVIEYKKDPKSFSEVPSDIKNNIKVLEAIIKKTFSERYFGSVRKISTTKPTKSKSIIEILCELNINQVKDTILNDEVKYQELYKLLAKKKIHCWLDRFGELPLSADIDLQPSTIASLIANYSEIRKQVFQDEANKTKNLLLSFINDYYNKNIEKIVFEGLNNQKDKKSDLIILVNQMSQSTRIAPEKILNKLLAAASMYRNENLETAINILNPEIKSQYSKDKIKIVLDKINNICWALAYDYVIKPSVISPTDKELTNVLKLVKEVYLNVSNMKEPLILENLFDSAIILNNTGIEDAIANIDKSIKSKYSVEDITKVLNEISKFVKTIKKGNIVSSTALLDIANCYDSSSKSLRILLGKEDFDFLKRNPAPNSSDYTSQERLENALKLIKELHHREYLTVPPSREIYDLPNNKKIKITIGDLHSFDNLTLGERTGACMRIGGAGESLFNFCLKNENGFHVKFIDPDNNRLVSRVSGFRNGNTVFLNQLRNSLSEKYTNENLYTACKLLARKLIDDSKDSHYPIENVVISPSLAMSEHRKETTNLGDIDIQKGLEKFYVDVDNDAILLATSNPDDSLVPVKTGPHSTEKYQSLRREVKIAYGYDTNKLKNQVILLDKHYANQDFDDVQINEQDNLIYCLQGEDWYITVDSKGHIDSYLMKTSNNKSLATDEMSRELEKLKDKIEQYGLQYIEERNIKGGI